MLYLGIRKQQRVNVENNMKEYQILVAGYRNGYLTTELIKVDGLSIEDAAFKAEQKSSLDGAAATGKR
jgi:hypothetical protein